MNYRITSRSAVFSECGRYRYSLSRSLEGGNGKRVMFLMLNPSDAGADRDDPTVRRCAGFTRWWGFTHFDVGNLYGLIATDPVDLIVRIHDFDAEGPDNQRHLMAMMGDADLVVPAWGANAAEPRIYRRASAVSASLQMLREGGVPVRDLGLTKGGHPRHPLFVPYNQALEDWPGYPARPGLEGRVHLAGDAR